ncbi:MAG: 23S rRNA (pseudouridine(1915)-N(3))-methyltransferase RlmH [Nitrospirae bacterium]|nr:23S rRNA (pseudouridine(1915)-N(3))-methyltransferase RlmH [Nitrospirota bacterium]MBI5695556.1 23S rRNA (pseudouridine(1915)-N(3))-methyltransferase RlmH [Nitrospirota bacterium]
MGILFLFVGKTKEGFMRDGIEKYAGLIKHYVPVEVREIKGSSLDDHAAAIEAEADSMLSRLLPGDCLIALDERGKNPLSVEFAGELGGMLETGRRLVFVIGGPFGLSARVRDRAELVLSLSRLTFTHEMARLILAEQVFRAFTIIKGRTYHY